MMKQLLTLGLGVLAVVFGTLYFQERNQSAGRLRRSLYSSIPSGEAMRDACVRHRFAGFGFLRELRAFVRKRFG